MLPLLQVRQLLRGYETMLGDVASDAEVFVTEECWVRPASDIAGLASVIRQQRPWDWSMRVAHFKADEEMRCGFRDRVYISLHGALMHACVPVFSHGCLQL